MEWIPSWAAKSYALLYVEKSTSWFDFDEAKSILKIKDKKNPVVINIPKIIK